MRSPRTVAIEAALESGRLLRERVDTIRDVQFKGEIDLVTDVDHSSEEIIIDRIQSAFPEHQILAEESGASVDLDRSTHRWLIDPLDGTSNYAHGFPLFSVSIALEVDGRIDLGVVYVPLLEELFVAQRGEGATLNGRRIRVSSTSTLLHSMLSTGFAYDPERRKDNLRHFAAFTYSSQAVRRSGSAAIDLCYVAVGRFDGFWEAGLNPWDVAAGSLLVTEAGGHVSNFSNGPFVVDSGEHLATNGMIHQQMMDVLAQVH